MYLFEIWEDFSYSFPHFLQELEVDLELTADLSEFVYVDGEEGDHGRISYRDGSGQVVVIKIVHGGDDEELEVTACGKPIIKAKLKEAFSSFLDQKFGIEE